MHKLLIATTNILEAQKIQKTLASDYTVSFCSNLDHIPEKLHSVRYDFLFLDIDLLLSETGSESTPDYRQLITGYRQIIPSLQIVLLSTAENFRQTVYVLKAGADDYMTFPIDAEAIKLFIENAYESVLKQSELDYLRDKFWKEDSRDMVKTSSPLMKHVYDRIKAVSPTRTTVLLCGETGTGKNVFAKLIHFHSNRSQNQFISVHCGAIPDTLIESELFGHEKGAFTGAVRRKLGKFEIANGGTIFLDEIGTIVPSVQIKLLQVLQEKTFHRVGGEETIEADVRIISATNENLSVLLEKNAFRKDLYYRLNVFPIEIPPLRKRLEDISLLVDSFLYNLNKHYGKRINEVHPMVLEAFQQYDWPGNIRELENLIERAYIIESSEIITPDSLPKELLDFADEKTIVPQNPSLTLAQARQLAVEELERQYLKEQLARNHGKINDTAEAAGISTRQLHKLMAKYRLNKREFKL